MNTCQENNNIWKFPHYEVGEDIDWDLLCATFAWLEDMKTVPQDKIWHAEGDVYTHTRMVVEELIKSEEYELLSIQDKHVMFAAAIMHDIEKRSTTRVEVIDGLERVVSPKHAVNGETSVRHIFYTKIKTPFEVREKIAKLIRWHGLPFWIIDENNAQKKIINISNQVNTELLYLLARSDARGRVAEDKEDTLLKIELYKEMCKENECYGKPRYFKTDLARFNYLNKPDVMPSYVPYDDLDFEVVVMCAIPGSGKDTYIKNNLDMPMLSLDELRIKNDIKRGDKKEQGRMIQEAKEQARVYMRERRSFVFNATNTTKDMRARWISLFLEYRARVKIIYIETNYENLKKQNKNREYSVSEEVLEDFIESLEMPTMEEAHLVEYIIH